MTRRNFPKETIELTLPLNPAYVTAARLTASTIADRLGFNIEEIEDIKAAVSEACAYIIKKSQSRADSGRATRAESGFTLTFAMQDGAMEIRIQSEMPLTDGDEEIAIQMIKALMDSLTIDSPDGKRIDIKMRKAHVGNEFYTDSYISASALI